jgi:putative DNA methylase
VPEKTAIKGLRLIEAGFPCHQVGAETKRERGASSALPPLYFLHVWWARRPLTPSRAAVLASLLPADTDPDWFIRQLGMEKIVAVVNGGEWVLPKTMESLVIKDTTTGAQRLLVDNSVLKLLAKEQARRHRCRSTIELLTRVDRELASHPVVIDWLRASHPLMEPFPEKGVSLEIRSVAANPAQVSERIEFAESERILQILGKPHRWDNEDLYGYQRAYAIHPASLPRSATVLDPTAGGGSIPFEALRLGCTVIANDLNPISAVILNATLDYPVRYGSALTKDLEKWGKKLTTVVESAMASVTPFSPLPVEETRRLEEHCRQNPEIVRLFSGSESDQMGLLHVRQVTCPHCGGEAPLLNTCWLSKTGEKWAVRVIADGRPRDGKVSLEPYRLEKRRGPAGEDPDFSTVSRGVGTCIHCRQAISSDEIKAQARGESPYGVWKDRLYCVAAVRYQPKLDKNGKVQRYRSGKRAGEIMTEKVLFFRAPIGEDLRALALAEQILSEKMPKWEEQDLLPTERILRGHKTTELLRIGVERWCDMFTPRQLLGHMTLVEELSRLKPMIIKELGFERGRAVITYLQFVIDKGLDYNSKQTRWHYSRGVLINTFGRHDFSLKWTFGEMVFSGPHSGVQWALSQVLDAYSGIAELVEPLHRQMAGDPVPVSVTCGTAANLDIADKSVDLVCMDPPYYNNVQYAELSDFFYVWQNRTLSDLYPGLYRRRLTNKSEEAVANTVRDGSNSKAATQYEDHMSRIFRECKRVLRDDGIMTVMFTHKSNEAWEALTRSLIESGWVITSSMPVESEASESIHQKDMAAASSSVFLSCRKRLPSAEAGVSTWTGIGGAVAQKVRNAVAEGLRDFEILKLNPVDEMVASYGRALKVLSEAWPVLDGDELVSPTRAMDEASAVVSQYRIAKITNGRLDVEMLNPETAMTLTLYGIFGLASFSYDQGLNLSRSLGISLESKTGGYLVDGHMVGINTELAGGTTRRQGQRGRYEEEAGYYAPLLRKGSKLRLALPTERKRSRLENPQSEWDIMQGLIMAFREGDIPVARSYLAKHVGDRTQIILDLLSVWTSHAPDEVQRDEGKSLLFGLR